MTVAVEGTVFLVNAGADGSRVAVIEGEVRVREGARETRLRPGEEVATNPTIAQRPLAEDISWSRNKDVHLRILESFKTRVRADGGTLQPVNPEPAAVRLPGRRSNSKRRRSASAIPTTCRRCPPGAGRRSE
jgi:hypothetical protein